MMTLDDLDIDDGLEVIQDQQTEPKDPEDEVKPWLEGNQDEDNDPNPDDEDNTGTEEDDDLITRTLKSRGINPDSVKIKNEDGEIEEVNFYDLPIEEQFDLLNYDNRSTEDYGLEQDEIGFLNHLRDNNMSVNDYLDFYRRQVIEEYQNGLQDTTTYSIEQYTDDELFIADLKEKIPDLTDEEAMQQLNLEKQNEAFFNKKVAGIRSHLKEKEKQALEQAEQEAQIEAEQRAAAYEKVIVDTIKENDSISIGANQSITLSEDDMNEIASFILDSDAAGVRYIAKALNDPKRLVGMAWYALKGEEALAKISEYYK